MEVQTTLFDFNKANMGSIKPLDPIWVTRKCAEVQKEMKENGRFWMLYCNELSDFTVFFVQPKDVDDKALIETLTNRGQITSFEQLEPHVYEIWIREEGEDFLYMLFNYDNAIVEF